MELEHALILLLTLAAAMCIVAGIMWTWHRTHYAWCRAVEDASNKAKPALNTSVEFARGFCAALVLLRVEIAQSKTAGRPFFGGGQPLGNWQHDQVVMDTLRDLEMRKRVGSDMRVRAM